MDEPEEDYWNRTRSKKKVNLFDDNVKFETASDLAKYTKGNDHDDYDEDNDDIETTNWDDTPVVKKAPGISPSVSAPSQTSTAAAIPKPSPDFRNDPNPSRPPTTYMTHSRSRSDVIVGNMGRMSLSKSPSVPFNQPSHPPARMDSEPSISSLTGSMDVRLSSYSRKPANKQEEEIDYLKQQLQNALKGQGAMQVKVEETVRRMITGQPISLEQYKSKADKISLLEKSLQTHDGNAIITAVLFLKRTMNEQLFRLELTRRPVAVDQYLSYLKAHYNMAEYERMLGMLGRNEELAILKYKQAASVEDSMMKIDRLKRCKQAHFGGQEHDAALIEQQICLLQRQRPVEVSDDLLEKQGKHIVFNQHPRVASIVNTPVITTLFYCCMYHWGEPENILSSPAAIKKQHQLTEKQYVWTAMRARAKHRKWDDIETLFTTKAFFGGTKMKSVLGFDRVADVLHKCGAPSEVLAKYLKLVDDTDKRLELAAKMQCHDAVIDTYMEKRDKKSLEQYQHRLKPNSPEWYYARDVLTHSNVKWKT